MAGRLNAYMDEGLRVDGAADGPLTGLTFAVKDLYDVAGTVAACGNPDWGRTHEPADAHAAAIDVLLAAGADLHGKTITDEFAFSIVGENHHFGTPENVNAPGRVCGGSSSGSAAVVAAGYVDFALGSDTGGSVRVPASFCGIFGLRPSHGRVSLDGVFPLAPSFDTVGWFARDPAVMAALGAVLLRQPIPEEPGAVQLLYPEDAWNAVPDATRMALSPAVAHLEAVFGKATRMTLAGADGLDSWFDTFRYVQGAEIWRTLGPWIEATAPEIGPGVKERLEWCRGIMPDKVLESEAQRAAITHSMDQHLSDPSSILVLPAAPGPALELGKKAAASDAIRASIIRLSGIAPLTRVPQLSLPVGKVDGMPIALSVMTSRGGDEKLLSLANSLIGPAENGVASLRG